MNKSDQKLFKFKIRCRTNDCADKPKKIKVFIKSHSGIFAIKYFLRCSFGFVFAFSRIFCSKVYVLAIWLINYFAKKSKNQLHLKSPKLSLKARLYLPKRPSEKSRIWEKLPSPSNSIFEKLVRNGLTVLVSVLIIFTVAVAAPPSSPYKPAETLNPDCLPGTANCTVEVSSGGGGGGGGTSAPAHMAKMRQTQAQSIPNDTLTKINFDTVEYDVGNIASTTSDRFTVAHDGKYLITTYWYSPYVINTTRVEIFISGAMKEEQVVVGGAGENANPMLSTVHSLAAGDYVEMYVRHNYGSAIDTMTSSSNYFQHHPQMTVTEVSAGGSGGSSGGGGNSPWSTNGASVYYNGGNVGVGTTNPLNRLMVAGPWTAGLGGTQVKIHSSGAGFPAGISGLGLTSQNGIGEWILYRYDDAAANRFAIGLNGVNEPFNILPSGNVGIGTTTPTTKLDVAGTMNAQEVRVNGQVLSPGTGSNWTVGGSNVYRLSGNVGIGVSNPTEKLEVDGLIKGGGTVGAWSVERTNYLQSAPLGPWADIPGLSITFTLSRPALVQMTTNGTQRTAGGGGTPGKIHVSYRYVIDGMARGDPTNGQRIQANEGTVLWWTTWAINDFVSLAAGSHTIKVQARNSGNVDSVATICGENNELGVSVTDYSNCVLNIMAAYQ